ncbi:MAG: zinc ribbon domain-containing protein [Methanobacteriota archaeon]|nr:MAG: zinc ribbon domain-containing protein [Euryarchaeota archaeon]
MKCGHCGKECPDDMSYCGYCGSLFEGPVVTPEPVNQRRCVGCGRIIHWDANACQYCGHDYRTRR